MNKLILIIVLILSTSCAALMGFSLLFAPKIDETSLKVNPALKKEQEVFVNKCSSCHPLISPKYKNFSEWEVKVNSYREQNIINDKEKEDILKYLEWASKE